MTTNRLATDLPAPLVFTNDMGTVSYTILSVTEGGTYRVTESHPRHGSRNIFMRPRAWAALAATK